MKSFLVALLVTLALTPMAHAQDAYDAVKTAGMFTIGGVGIAGTTAPSETAFRELLKQSEPVAHCKKLLEEGSPAGQMYGLLGLRLLNDDDFLAALPRYKDAKETVSTASGCIVFAQTEAAIALEIESGRYK